MPLHVLPTRRQFLASSLAAGAALSIPRFAGADDAKNTATFALLADSHIAADKEAILREVKMAEHLAKVWEEVRAAKPSGMLLHGDVAVLKGEAGDYRAVADLLIPDGKEEFPLHFLLGNHDASRVMELATITDDEFTAARVLARSIDETEKTDGKDAAAERVAREFVPAYPQLPLLLLPQLLLLVALPPLLKKKMSSPWSWQMQATRK